MLKTIILIGGPQKGTRFRPLSLDIPKPLFPVAGFPLIQHLIEACSYMKEIKEILLIGFYPAAQFQSFINEIQSQYNVAIKYLQEYTALGTAGGLYHFRDQISSGQPDAFFVINGDVCADFPLEELYCFHKSKEGALGTIMGTGATKQQSVFYGCMVIDQNTHALTHYVEKPSSYVSSLINCGVYVFSLEIFKVIGEIFASKASDSYRNDASSAFREFGYIGLEEEILSPLAGSGRIFALQVNNWWSQLKTASSAIYANRHYLELYRSKHPERLIISGSGDNPWKCRIISDVHIHPTAQIHPTAILGPNVSIGPGVYIGPGVRIRESIILQNAIIESHTLILHSIIGRECKIGKWARIEGTPSDPDPNKPFSKMDNPPLFKRDGRLNPTITILGCAVTVPSEIILLNVIVLPHKELSRSYKNEIIL